MIVVEESDDELVSFAPTPGRAMDNLPAEDLEDAWETLHPLAAESDGSLDESDRSDADRARALFLENRLRQRNQEHVQRNHEKEKQGLVPVVDPSFRCYLCMGYLVRPVVAPCGHAFCWGCWEQHRKNVAQKIYCPTCSLQVNARGGQLDVSLPLMAALDSMGIIPLKSDVREKAVGHFSGSCMSVNQLRAEAARIFQTHGRQYTVICADPPWKYENVGCRGNAEDHYPCMHDQAIAELPVGGLARKDCALLLWTTFPKLETGLRVLRMWGFRYVTCIWMWIKVHRRTGLPVRNPGWWTAPCAEPVLLGTRGSPGFYKRVKMMSSVLCTYRDPTRITHSRKPDAFYRRVQEFFGSVPCIDLFARTRRFGWDVWGNDTEHFSPELSVDSLNDEREKRRQDHRANQMEEVIAKRRRT